MTGVQLVHDNITLPAVQCGPGVRCMLYNNHSRQRYSLFTAELLKYVFLSASARTARTKDKS